METGIISEAKCGKTRETKMSISVFASSNGTRNLLTALLSRFFVVDLKPYTCDEFHQITARLLHHQGKVAPAIADSVWNTTKNIRDCIRIGKLAKSEEDVNFLINTLHSADVELNLESEKI
jgi:Holliday junction DNA helicase RuvB